MKTRGNIIPGKLQTSWRINERVLDALDAELKRRGKTPRETANLVNEILYIYFFGN